MHNNILLYFSNFLSRYGLLAPNEVTEAQLFYANQIYENAYHPDTAEIQNVFGRLSFVPIGKTLLVAALLSQSA